MAELNKANCKKKIRNTGKNGCPIDFGPFIGGFLAPVDKVWKKSEIVDLRALLQAAVLAPLGARIYPFHGWETPTKNTQEPTFATMASGRSVFVKEGDIDVTYQFIDGGLCLSNRLRSFNNDLSFGLIRYDANFRMQGTEKLDSDGNVGFAPIPLKVNYTFPADENDHTNPTVYRTRYSFHPRYVNELVAFIDADFPLTEINGLIDIKLEIVGTPTGGVYQVEVLAGCEGENLFDKYSTQLASAALWKIYNVTTGNEITVSAAPGNVGLKTIAVTASTADADYTAATATGKIRIEMVGPVALDAADISGYEAEPITIVRGA